MTQCLAELNQIYREQILNEEKEENYGEKYEDKYKKSGKKSKDYDEDGEVEDESDEYAGVKDKAIRKKKEKENEDDCMKTEAFSNWRSDLREVMSVIDPKDSEIKEKPVKNKIKINPPVSESIELIDEQELDEEFILETVDIATNHLFEMGLNEHGLELVVEQLGEERFLEYVFNLSEDYMLTEARRSGRIEPVTSTGKPIASLKGGAKAASIRSKQKQKAARDVTPERPSGMTAALKSQSEVAKKLTASRGDKAVKTAVAQQPKTRSKADETKDKIARGILGFISGAQKQYEKGMKRHRAAMQMASVTAKTGANVAKTLKKGAEVAGKELSSGLRVGTGMETLKGKETKLGRNVAAASIKGTRKVSRAARDVVAREVARTKVKPKVNETVQYILEKAVSEQQQKIFGVALAVKRGEVPRSKVSDKVLEIVDSLSEKEIRKFAATSHAGIPHKR